MAFVTDVVGSVTVVMASVTDVVRAPVRATLTADVDSSLDTYRSLIKYRAPGIGIKLADDGEYTTEEPMQSDDV
jgi:hypothetical protein